MARHGEPCRALSIWNANSFGLVRGLLANPEKNVWATDGIKAVEDGYICAVLEIIDIAGHGSPGIVKQIASELGYQDEAVACAGGNQNDICSHRDCDDLIGRWWHGRRQYCDNSVKAMGVALIIEGTGKVRLRKIQCDDSGGNGLWSSVTISEVYGRRGA